MKNINYTFVAVLAVVIAAVSLFVSVNTKGNSTDKDLASTVLSKGTIKIGYIEYPPSLIKDPNTGKLSGISYDIVEKAASNLGLKTEWVEEVGFGTMIEGLKAGRYDMVGTMVWPNANRAREATFSIPPLYSLVFPYVRANDTRFDQNVMLANSDSTTLATVDGEMTTFIAKSTFPKAKTYALPQLSSVSEALTGLTTGKADMTFVELSVANDFLKTHAGAIKQAGTTPVRLFGNSFVFARGQNSLTAMWNIALTEIINDGTVGQILAKYNAQDSFKSAASPVGTTW